MYSIEINSCDNIYVSAHNGIFVSYDNGQNWEDLNDGLIFYPEYVYIDTFDFLYGFVDQIAPYKLCRSINPTVNIKDQYETTPASIFIYPNPFKRQLFVNISTKKQSYIEVVILNSMGQIIKKSNSFAIDDKTNFKFNFSNYSNGIYFVVAKIDGVIKVSEKIIKSN